MCYLHSKLTKTAGSFLFRLDLKTAELLQINQNALNWDKVPKMEVSRSDNQRPPIFHKAFYKIKCSKKEKMATNKTEVEPMELPALHFCFISGELSYKREEYK